MYENRGMYGGHNIQNFHNKQLERKMTMPNLHKRHKWIIFFITVSFFWLSIITYLIYNDENKERVVNHQRDVRITTNENRLIELIEAHNAVVHVVNRIKPKCLLKVKQ